MKKFIFLFVVFFCHSLITFAQSNHLNLVKSPEYKLSEPTLKESGISKIFKVGNEYVAIRNERTKGFKKSVFFLERYDADLELLESIKVLDFLDEKNNSVLTVKKLGSSFLFITENMNKKEKKITTYAQLVSTDTYKKSEKIELFSSPYKKRGEVSIQLSPNGEILLASIYFERIEKMEYKTYSSDLKLLYEYELILGGDISKFELNKAFVTDVSEIIIAGKATDATGNRAHKTFFKVYTISNGNNDSYDFEEDINDIHFSNPFLTQNKDGNLIGGGYYGGRDFRIGTFGSGEYMFTFDITEMEVTHFVSHEFTEEFILEGKDIPEKVYYERKKRGMLIGIKDVTPTDIVVLDNGNYFLIGTVIYVEYNSQGTPIYYTNDIIVSIAILNDDDDRFEWTKRVFRRSFYTDVELALHSYNYIVQGDKINIFYYGGLYDLDAVSAVKSRTIYKDNVLISVRLDNDEENDIYRGQVTENQYDLISAKDQHNLFGIRVTESGKYVIGKIALTEE